ncbi:MAG: hypothetical protein R3B70_25975 [Polyangiaceae bacterium]
MIEIQPSFFQWRKKVSGALALDPKRVTLLFTAANGRVYSIEPEELQNPQAGTYTAKLVDGNGIEQEVSSDYDIVPDRPVRRSPEDALIARYERMADDMEHARRTAENRAQAAEAEKFAALEMVGEQQKRIFELEQRISELESQQEGLFDDDTAALILEAVDRWTGAAELRGHVSQLLVALEQDPRASERIVRRVPELIAELVRHVQTDAE